MSTERHRMECEARHWLQHTRGNGAAINELLERIQKRRGEAGAEKLRMEMRRQYREAQA